MTQDEIIEMTRQAGGFDATPKFLEAFANLVAQHERERIKQANAPEIERVNAHIKKLEDAVLAEREACAKVCDDLWQDDKTAYDCREAIRARGQA
jgi:hypothetical protein